MGVMRRNAYQVLVLKPEEEGPPETLMRRWQVNIKMILEKWSLSVGTEFMWFRMGSSHRLLWTQYRLHKRQNFLTCQLSIGFSRKTLLLGAGLCKM
jgi:hypothetical protein